MAKQLMKGNEAIAEAAILCGCRYFFGYPITPQNQIPEYMSKRMPQIGGCFLQAESEVAAINMVYGASSAGGRVMTSSSSPGISLKQEGISYIVGAELPCVIVNMVRGGPGLGGIQPAQSDYFQATRGGGHGDYRMPVLAPANVQEAVQLTQLAFDLADQYRNPAMILGDGMLGQVIEPVDMSPIQKRELPPKTWATTGWDGTRPRNISNSLYIDPADLEKVNLRLMKKYEEIEKNEVMVECVDCEEADILLVAYGTMARIARRAAQQAKAELGLKVGLVRPITLWPFPTKVLHDAAAQKSVKRVISVEMSLGQMVDDVRIAVNGEKEVSFFGRTGGMVPTVREILTHLASVKEGM